MDAAREPVKGMVNELVALVGGKANQDRTGVATACASSGRSENAKIHKVTKPQADPAHASQARTAGAVEETRKRSCHT